MYPLNLSFIPKTSQPLWWPKILVLLGLTISVAFSACKKNGDTPPVVNTTYLDVVNADSSTLNIYQNGTRINNLSGLYQYGSPGYLTVNAGTTNFGLKKAGSTNYLVNNYTLTLDTDNLYSLFIAGETADKIFSINDGRGLPDSTTVSSIRFVDASPSANLSVTIGKLNFTNRAFKSATGFYFITSAITTVTVYQYGSATPLLTQSVTLVAGTVYTLLTTGVIGGTGQNQLTAQLITNSSYD